APLHWPAVGRTERHPDQHQDVQAHSLAIPHCSSWLIICRQTTPRTAPSQAIRRRSLITVKSRLKWHLLEAAHPPAAQAVRGLAEPFVSAYNPRPHWPPRDTTSRSGGRRKTLDCHQARSQEAHLGCKPRTRRKHPGTATSP